MGATQSFVGLMSGTSADGIDACVTDFDEAGEFVRMRAYASTPYSEPLRARLTELGQANADISLQDYARLDHAVGEAFAAAAVAIIKDAELTPANIAAIGHHGQTLFHGPGDNTRNTLQIGDANLVAAATGRPVVADLRRADMAAGGQGAPLAPGLHAALWRSRTDRAVINVGGIANVTLLPADPDNPIIAFDTGPGNGLLDAWMQHEYGLPMDRGGARAAAGEVENALLERLRGDGYFDQPPPKSTGRESFSIGWLLEQLDAHATVSKSNIPATLLELTVQSIADAVKTQLPNCTEAYVCGGGAYNPVLMTRLAQALQPAELHSTQALGLAPDAVEAVAFSWLAMRRVRGLPSNLPSVTGASRPVLLGAIYQTRG